MKKQNTTHGTRKGRQQGYIDWAKVDATTEEDIERHAREDGEVEWTPEMLRRSHLFRPRKQGIHIMVDPDILDFFRQGGRGYQSRIHAALRAYVDAHRKVG